jgi:hypothetical protein
MGSLGPYCCWVAKIRGEIDLINLKKGWKKKAGPVVKF